MGTREYLLDKAKNQGIEKGKLEGKLEGLLETARKMIAKNFDKKEIADITGLTLEQLKKL